jgi:hypothetical protein
MAQHLISPNLKIEFREFCVNLFLRQIDNCFQSYNVEKRNLPPSITVSGQRRTLVEEYYQGLNWSDPSDAQTFLNVVQKALNQSNVEDNVRKQFINVLQQEGYVLNGLNIVKASSSLSSNDRQIASIPAVVSNQLNANFAEILQMEPQRRGYQFEKFLGALFQAYELSPRSAFRMKGEQIDGSFQLSGHTYLVEAKWQNALTPQEHLLAFQGKIDGKAGWSRGLFISFAGFSSDGLEAFARGKATRIIGMDGQDIHFILSGEMSLIDAIEMKARKAAESNEFFVSIFQHLRQN